jgi:hypothetical protein
MSTAGKNASHGKQWYHAMSPVADQNRCCAYLPWDGGGSLTLLFTPAVLAAAGVHEQARAQERHPEHVFLDLAGSI